MPRDSAIKKVMVIGSGPIVIGQAAEFDYAGTQACRALREEGIEVVLVNSNPATIMTDKTSADKIYIEPLKLETVKRIILKEKPDSILSTLGGQTGLTLCMQLAKEGFLKKHNVRLLGAKPETIDRAEDRLIFKNTMQKIGQPCVPSEIANDVECALKFAEEIGYPVIVRPAFTLGGSGGGIAEDAKQLEEIAANGIRMSPIGQILVERCIAGWKEIEFEVMRDGKGNVITVCSMENFDPVGVHTGDSIVVAPALTLSDKEYQMLRTASLDIITAMEIEGGCNCQFALNPSSMEYAVIEVNPRVSRSSALASKATGYPIAKVATKIAIGYTLDEIKNAVTGKTYACFEPALDYVVVKFPKWPFDKFIYAKRTLGTQMKATGEVMAIAPYFESALMKAVRGAEISLKSLSMPKLAGLSDEAVEKRLYDCNDERLFVIYEAILRGTQLSHIHDITKIDMWFLSKLKNIADIESSLKTQKLTDERYLHAKKFGFPDEVIETLSGQKIREKVAAVYKMVDTCAGEFEAQTPYFYSTYDKENEAERFVNPESKKVIVFGSGPIRIGQGIEFDYASVHAVKALKKLGYTVVIVNNNPETVSTDFDTADRLYFEPLTEEDVLNVIRTEKPYAAVVAFGGQTAIKLTKFLENNKIRILGTSAESIDMAEDREKFDDLLNKIGIARPDGKTVFTEDEAVSAANTVGYPVLMRPSYVLGGQNMIIAFDDKDIREYMGIILKGGIENPVLIDQYLMGTEIEVDAICDGKEILIPGIMEHVERAGVHSGDSIAVYPTWNLSSEQIEKVVDYTKKLAVSLKTKGLVNIQYVVYKGDIYVIEVNPRSSRTVPYITKVTGVPMIELAVRAMLGEKLSDMGYGTGLYRKPPYVAVKVPVFSFEKLTDADILMGPEMKSTGEVLGIGKTLDEALYKGLTAAGYKMAKNGGILITVKDKDKSEAADVARAFSDLGFRLYATKGTAEMLKNCGFQVTSVHKLHEDKDDNIITLIESGKVNYILSTSSKGRLPERDSVKIRRKAVELAVPCLTSIDTANALAKSIKSRFSEISTELVNINDMRTKKESYDFVKMQGCGNDYIYFNCLEREIPGPESLSVYLSDRHLGIGGDGIVMICPSKKADASMRMFNLDGSEGRMCGNAIRCVGKYLYDTGICKKTDMKIETLSGIKNLKLYISDGEVVSVRVDMGAPIFENAKIPTTLADSNGRVTGVPLTVAGAKYSVTCLSMGNPHCVVFMDNIDNLDIETMGYGFEHAEVFPQRVNTEFIKIVDPTTIKMRVWERGSGETLACGTGACASAVAAILNGKCEMGKNITVKLKGGDLVVNYDGKTVYMTGDAVKVFEGSILI